MNKPITKKDGLYKEALAWMSYRYAMGMTDYVSRKGYSELERYRQFMDIAFGSEEFRALVNAFCDFLKRKKIKDVITLKENYLEQDLIWLSKNYAMGRHSYAAAHWQDIVRYSQDVLTEAQKKHNASDIRREIAMHLQFQNFNFCIPHYMEETHSPMDLFLTFITENDIDTVEKLLQYKRIEVVINNDGHIEYATSLRDDDDKKDTHFWPMMSIDDYLGWDALASFFYPPCHKVCRTLFNDQEELIPYFDAWQYDYSGEGTLKYKKVKRPLDKFRIEPWAAWSINEEYIVEDNINDIKQKGINYGRIYAHRFIEVLDKDNHWHLLPLWSKYKESSYSQPDLVTDDLKLTKHHCFLRRSSSGFYSPGSLYSVDDISHPIVQIELSDETRAYIEHYDWPVRTECFLLSELDAFADKCQEQVFQQSQEPNCRDAS